MAPGERADEPVRNPTFTSRSLASGTVTFVRNLPGLIRARRADRVGDRFAEKIMLAVTAVNECQYCTRYHTSLARETGVSEATITGVLERDVDAAVDDVERPALVFAQRYAETEGEPGRDAVAALRDEYGPSTAADIRAFVRAIHVANLLGNTYDAVRIGIAARVRAASTVPVRLSARLARRVGTLRERCPF